MRLFLLLPLALALAACDSALADDPSDATQDPALLVGTWDLLSVTTSGYGAPVTTTPVAELDETATYTFRADGTVDVLRDGALVESTTYAVEVLAGVDPQPLLRIGTETDYRHLFFGVTESRFYIDHRPYDGDLLTFARR